MAKHTKKKPIVSHVKMKDGKPHIFLKHVGGYHEFKKGKKGVLRRRIP